MKKLLSLITVVCLFFSGIGATAAFAEPANAQPVIFFSDLTSGPNAGGRDNNGVFVTIVGRHFGDKQGGSCVMIGGGQAANYPVWTDRKVTFQLGPTAHTGDITVQTVSGTSNGIHFTVRDGRIFFVDAKATGNGSGTYEAPWQSPKSFFDAQQAGDTCYFRAGTYDGQYGNSSRSYNVSFYNTNAPGGSADREIAWVGYPGETALFKADQGNVTNGAFEVVDNKQYYVFAGLSIYGRGDGREQVRLYSDNCKLVNCNIEGIKTLSYAMVGVIASNLKIWGNELHGATSRNKLDHIFYFQDGTTHDVDIGWNDVHDNDIAVGPVFSWNINGNTSNNIQIHDNLIDCRNSSDTVRLAGIWNGAGGSITFANNIVIGAGGSLSNDDSYNVIYAAFGRINVYHNTFYQCRGTGSSNYIVNFFGGASGEVKNNIFYNEPNIGYVNGNATVDTNLYFGGAGGPPAGDTHAVAADPQFVDAQNKDFHIKQSSPALGKGTNVSVQRDFDGIPRSMGGPSIGAYQYYAGGPLTGNSVAVGTGNGAVNVPGNVFNLQPGEVKVLGGSAHRGPVDPTRGEAAVIYYRGTKNGKYVCRVISLTGDLVWESSKSGDAGGTFTWSPNGIASGIYVANVQGPGLRASQKVAVLK